MPSKPAIFCRISCAIITLIVVSTGSADDQLPTVETIRKSYLAAITPIFTLDCEMRLEFQSLKQDSLKDSAQRFDSANVHLWRKGKWRALLNEFTDGNGQPSTAVWYGFDGNLYGRFSMSLRPTEKQEWLPGGALQAEKDNNLFESFTIDRLTGETLGAGDLPLIALLSDTEATVVGRKDISRSSCIEVHFPRHMSSRKFPEMKTIETTVWFDPKQSYLPRLIHRLVHHASPPQLHEFETTEFGQFVGEDKQTYTLPVAGENRNLMTRTRLKLIRATINGPLSDQLFKPDFPPMTEVVQELPDQPPQRVTVGDPEERQRAQDAINARAEKKNPPLVTIKPPSAHPRDSGGWMSNSWFQFLACLTIVGILVFGIRAWRMRE